MIRSSKAPLPASRLATAFAAALAVSGFAMSADADESRSNASLPASASIVRNTIVAMSLADAALPFATAVSTVRDANALLPATAPAASAVLKPETSGAMASMRGAYARRPGVVSDNSYFDRRYRPYRDPFVLILGVAY